MTLMARLGLRAGEVAALELQDIDWRAGELVVRGKGALRNEAGSSGSDPCRDLIISDESVVEK